MIIFNGVGTIEMPSFWRLDTYQKHNTREDVKPIWSRLFTRRIFII